MQRIVLTLISCTCLIGMAGSAPVRPLFEPKETPPSPPPRRVVVDLTNTVWQGKYHTTTRFFVFEADGTLSYRSATKAGKLFKNRGTWRLEGNVLIFEHFINPNTKLMHFRGTIQNSSTIVGEATYPQQGTKANQTLQRTTLDAK